MITLPVYDMAGKQVDSYEFDPLLLAKEINTQLLHDAVVMYQANLRQGSAATKTRAEVAGAKKKMYRQKGTGNARAGHRRSGVRRGGGHIFAKKARDFSYRLPRKSLQVATRMAILCKIESESLTLVNELLIPEIKTKKMVQLLAGLNISESVLVATDKYDMMVYKSGRNISGVKVLPASDLNAYEILRPKKLVMTKQAFESFQRQVPQTVAE